MVDVVLQPASVAGGRRTLPVAAVMLASGFAGLGYQIVWTQQCALWLGHEAAAVLAVVTAFFGGLALGAWTLGRWIERSPVPERWYAACETVIALWSLALAGLMGPVGAGLIALTGAQPSAAWQWTVTFVGTFVLLLPATAAMGATLPAMERVVARWHGRATSIAGLYAANTAGAVIGVLTSAFWLVPAFGLQRTAGWCALLNLACAGASLTLTTKAPSTLRPVQRRVRRPPMALLALTGLLGIGYEVLVVRVISQTTENTVYTFAMLLAVYLIGTSLGAAAYQRFHSRGSTGDDATVLQSRLLTAVAMTCLAGTASLWMAESWRDAAQRAFGAGMPSAIAAESVLALAAFALPTVAMGALFSHLCTEARDQGSAFSRSLAVNTLGAAVAPMLFGVLLLPGLGAKFALLSIVAGYGVLAAPRGFRPTAWLTVGTAALLALAAPPLVFIDVPAGGHVVSYREGVMAAVSVVADAQGVSRLRIDNRQQEGSSHSRMADGRQALLPLLLHPAPSRALFLGLGTGVTASTAAEDPGLQVDAVELLPEVIEASAHFTAAQPRLHLMAADARRFVRSAGASYDVIVSDNFHPARSGSGALYTVEHFRAVRSRLAVDGVFCQWLPLHQLDLETLRSIVRSYLEVFPQATAMLSTNSLETPVLGLVSRSDDGRFDVRAVRQRLSRELSGYGLTDEFAVLGSIVAGPQALKAFAGDAPINTDDRPVVAYGAPRITYAPDSRPSDRLSDLLHRLASAATDPAEWLVADDATRHRLAAYEAARDRFIDAGRNVKPLADPRAMLNAVREPLLAVLRLSPDFRPAYDPLLRLSLAISTVDSVEARALLEELSHLQPNRPEAARALAALP